MDNRLNVSNTYKKQSIKKDNDILLDDILDDYNDIEKENIIIDNLKGFFGENYNFEILEQSELKQLYEYAMAAFKNKQLDLLDVDKLPLDLNIIFNKVPELEDDTIKNNRTTQKSKKQDNIFWNKKFDHLEDKDVDMIILEINFGNCNKETKDFIENLLNIYKKRCIDKDLNILEEHIDDKNFSLSIKGKGAYNTFKFEKGCHCVKNNEFVSNVYVSIIEPENKIDDVELNKKDLKIDVFRAQGAGGQHVNKTSSAVRITHLPTNLSVAIDSRRSQYQNKKYAMDLLKMKLINKQKEEQLNNEKNKIIKNFVYEKVRTYDLSNNLLIDHRINYKMSILKNNKIDLTKLYIKLNKTLKQNKNLNIEKAD